MGGLIFMNAVLQIVITPLLNRVMGAEQLGGLLYITGLIAIVCPSVGQALNTSRLVVRRNFAVTNGDYDWILLVFGAIGSGVALWMSRNSLEGPVMAVGVFVLFMFIVFRYYGDVEYRLNLNYQRYFIYYLPIWLNGDQEKMDQKEILGRIRPYLGEEARIKVEIVDEIPVLASGKRKYIENRCEKYKDHRGICG